MNFQALGHFAPVVQTVALKLQTKNNEDFLDMNYVHSNAYVCQTIPGNSAGRMRGVTQASAWLDFEEFTQAELPLCMKEEISA